MLFQAFPDAVLMLIGCQWLDAPDLTRWDTACCNEKDRKLIVELFNSSHFVIPSNKYSTYGYIEWICRRKIRLSGIIIDWSDTDVEMISQLLDCSCLKSIRISGRWEEKAHLIPIISLINRCTGLKKIDMKYGDKFLMNGKNDGNIISPHILSQLNELIIHPLDDTFNAESMEYLATHCQNLTLFSLDSLEQILTTAQIQKLLVGNPNLESLFITNESTFEPSLLPILAQYAPSLRKFSGMMCCGVNLVEIAEFLDAKPEFFYLELLDAGTYKAFVYSLKHADNKDTATYLTQENSFIRVNASAEQTAEALLEVFKVIKSVNQITIASAKVNSDLLYLIAKQHSELHTLELNSSQGNDFTVDSLKSVLTAGCTGLRSLEIKQSGHLPTDELVSAFKNSNCRQSLNKLVLTGHSTLSAGDVIKILSSNTAITEFYFHDCATVNTAEVKAFVETSGRQMVAYTGDY